MHEVAERPEGVRVVERMLRDGFARGDAGVVDELCAPDLIGHQFGQEGSGAEAIAKVKAAIAQVHRAFPDLAFETVDWAQRGDVVRVHASGAATSTGPFFGPPTGGPVRFSVVDVARVRDGRIVEHWGVPDRFAILAQLGRLPSRREAAPAS